MKKILNSFWPFIVIFFIWITFAIPFFMKGKVPFPSTYMVNNFAPWSAYPQFASPVKNGAMPDLITQIYPWKHFTIEQWKKGQIPLWNPYSFSGTPHLANYQSAVLSPVNLLFFVFPFVTAWSLSILLQPLLAGLFMYLYIRSLSISKLGSLLSSISFMFCGFVVTWMDYGTLAYAILFLPLALFAIEKYIKTKRMWFLILLSLSIPFSFFSGHFQTSIYFYLFTAIYAIFVSLREKNWKLLLWIGLYGIFGLLLSMPQILPSLEFYTQSVRSGLFEKVEIIPWAYLPTLIAPDFYGNPVTRNDWFGHYAEWNAYAGLVPLILGLYSIKRLSKQIIFFGVSAIVILLLAFPSPLLNAMVALHIPVLSTSSASRIIVLFSFIIASLAGFGFDLLLKDVEKNIFKPILILLGGFAGIYCVLWVIVVRKLFLPIDKIVIAKQNMLLPTILFICILLLIAGIYLLRKIIKQKLIIVLFAGLIALVVFDMLRFATKWQPFDPNLLMYPNVPVIDGFKQIEGYNRVLGNFDAGTGVYYHLPSVEGYDALYIRKYGQLVASMTDGKLQDSYRSAVSFIKNNQNTLQMVKLLNITYIVHKKSDDFVGWTFPYWDYSDQFKQIFEDNSYRIFENTKALPHAFVASNYAVNSSDQQKITTLLSKTFNPAQTVILDKNPGFTASSSNNASATITSYTPNRVAITATTQKRAVLVLLDNNYPGWNAEVDGKQVSVLTADYSFRGIVLPSGTHKIVFSFEPLSFIIGLWLGVIGIIGVVLGTILKKITKI